MTNRRSFLKYSGAVALGAAAFHPKAFAGVFAPKGTPPAGLQLFTLFTVMDKDVPGALKAVKEAGFSEIESAFSMLGGYYGKKPKEFAALAKDAGLSWVSHHVMGAPFKMPPGGIKIPGADTTRKFNPPPMRNLKENTQQLVDEAAEGGLKYLVCAGIPHGTMADVKDAIEVLSKAGEACKKAGLTFCYHNHTTEFDQVEGEIPYHHFLAETSPETVKMELDLGWATKAGIDPVELFSKHPGRFPLWHVKDLDKDSKEPTEIGRGFVDLKRIFAAASKAGMKHFFVEQDMPKDPFSSIKLDYAGLAKILG